MYTHSYIVVHSLSPEIIEYRLSSDYEKGMTIKQALKFSEDPRSGLLTHEHTHTQTNTHTHRHREKEKGRS